MFINNIIYIFFVSFAQCIDGKSIIENKDFKFKINFLKLIDRLYFYVHLICILLLWLLQPLNNPHKTKPQLHPKTLFEPLTVPKSLIKPPTPSPPSPPSLPLPSSPYLYNKKKVHKKCAHKIHILPFPTTKNKGKYKGKYKGQGEGKGDKGGWGGKGKGGWGRGGRGRLGISRKGMLRWARGRRRGKGSWKLGSPIVAVKRSLELGSL